MRHLRQSSPTSPLTRSKASGERRSSATGKPSKVTQIALKYFWLWYRAWRKIHPPQRPTMAKLSSAFLLCAVLISSLFSTARSDTLQIDKHSEQPNVFDIQSWKDVFHNDEVVKIIFDKYQIDEE